MSRLFALTRVALAVVVTAIAGVGAFAAAIDNWPLAAISGLSLLLLGSYLLLHLHRKTGKATRSLTDLHRKLVAEIRLTNATLSSMDPTDSSEVTARVDGLRVGFKKLAADLADIDARLAQHHEATARTDALLEDHAEATTSGLRQLEEQAKATSSRLRRLSREHYRLTHEPVTELDALHQLRQRVPLTGRRPTVWGFALSPRALLQLVDIVERRRPNVVVECGSGLSSLYLGELLQHTEGARVVSLEHDPDFAEETREFIGWHGLEDVVDVRIAPLTEMSFGDTAYRWYDRSALEDLAEVDLLLVDGPPEASGPRARYPALPNLVDRLAPGAVVILDDTQRDTEASIVEAWLQEFPALQRTKSAAPNQAVLVWRP